MEKGIIAIIGTGHIGRALFKGLAGKKVVSPAQIILTNHHREKLSDLHKQHNVVVTSDNLRAVENSEVIIFCVKPKDMKQVVYEVREKLDRTKLIISVAACVTIDLLENYLGDGNFQIVRIIPNIPVAYGEGVIGWIDNGKVKKEKLSDFRKLFSRLGLLVRCPNDEGLEKLSMVAGCGIGYVAYFMKSLAQAAEKYGFSGEEAQKIARTVFFSTVDHLRITNQTADELIASVATRGGITEEVLKSLDRGKFLELFVQSINVGFQKVVNTTSKLKKEL